MVTFKDILILYADLRIFISVSLLDIFYKEKFFCFFLQNQLPYFISVKNMKQMEATRKLRVVRAIHVWLDRFFRLFFEVNLSFSQTCFYNKNAQWVRKKTGGKMIKLLFICFLSLSDPRFSNYGGTWAHEHVPNYVISLIYKAG